jgi:hypothetical protein
VSISFVIFGALYPVFVAAVYSTAGARALRLDRDPGRFAGTWSYSAAGMVIASAASTDWSALAGGVLSLAAAIAWRWWRKNRKRATEALGAKGEALRDALVRSMKQAAKPRPVLRPSLRGAP